MKRILIIFAILFFVTITGYYFINTVFFIKKFHQLGQIAKKETPYDLPVKFLVLQNVHSEKTDTINFKSKTIINFWASWCKPCLTELPYFDSLSRIEDSSFRIAIISFESPSVQKKFLSNKGMEHYFIGDSSQYFKSPEVLPLTLFIENYKVVQEFYGVKKWDTIAPRFLNKRP
ncbi:MAG: redoxin family protein [Flavihumibacter sp.]|nr:redoxin family protein [Flavihumibacter sp.]